MALAAVTPVIGILEHLDVPYHIGGSFAFSAYGIPRATADVDLVAKLANEHVDQFVEQLGDWYYVDRERVLEAVAQQDSFNVIHLDTYMKVDIFVTESAPFAEQEQQRARREPFGDDDDAPAFLVKSPEDLILRKLLWFRAGHEVSEQQWNDVLGLIKVWPEELDGDYLRRWAAELQITDLLSRALQDANS